MAYYYYRHGKEIGLVYLRAGYTPRDYPTDAEWKGREILECSMAIKCPSIDLHLVTFKIFQEHFGQKDFLEKYLTPAECAKLREFLTDFWSLKDKTKEAEENIKKAIEHPEEYVVKSHREGGGNNYYMEELRKVLMEGQKDWNTLQSLFLMEKIATTQVNSYLLVNGEVSYAKTVSEYSRFGVFISDKSKMLQNYDGGHLVRTKKAEVGEGGVAMGSAVINIPYTGDYTLKEGRIELEEI
eukprot:TRINITY_DN1061_c0_g1_i5.p2 TRINITY_DN1061_c0_g1~~TRINITY_DN1061_c0_g1_i5.p2  ORF type:complete len:240 (+),score=85.84 TRINITY_DN1061_c0_g1_i5:894-1613(+)